MLLYSNFIEIIFSNLCAIYEKTQFLQKYWGLLNQRHPKLLREKKAKIVTQIAKNDICFAFIPYEMITI